MDSHLRFFILLVPIFVTILKTDAFNNDRVFLVSPRQRDSSRNNTCMIPAEKSNVTCCVCPDNCELTYPRKPTKIYSMGIKVFRFYFSMKGSVNRNILNIHLYICVRNSTSDIISQECLQKNPLRLTFSNPFIFFHIFFLFFLFFTLLTFPLPFFSCLFSSSSFIAFPFLLLFPILSFPSLFLLCLLFLLCFFFFLS
ncbi:unnamed protein product [Acanthosepion pharaonis]|uniref:Uncharacterized protein n=1 Tax=Acanthosepion pharaonis TaxID=158019 RepID=A0A812ELQ5_ACAPH|nr:unnamed protein product [Sepia pharaonis]